MTKIIKEETLWRSGIKWPIDLLGSTWFLRVRRMWKLLVLGNVLHWHIFVVPEGTRKVSRFTNGFRSRMYCGKRGEKEERRCPSKCSQFFWPAAQIKYDARISFRQSSLHLILNTQTWENGCAAKAYLLSHSNFLFSHNPVGLVNR